MLFKIDAETRGGLRVIPAIPNIKLCWLEGQNGIGKTAAVRLLELVAGRQPFSSNPDAWASFKENLGKTTIEISDFPSSATVQSIEVELTPEKWPDDPVTLTGDLGNIFVDGTASDHLALREQIDIVCIGGNETIVSQLRNLVGTDLALVVRCRNWLEDIAKEAESILSPLILDLNRLSTSEFANAKEEVQLAQHRLTAANSRLHSSDLRRKDLQELLELYELQKEQQALGPSVQADLKDSTARVQDLTRKKDALAEHLQSLVPDRAASKRLQKELDRLQKLRDGRRKRAARTLSTARRILQTLELAENDLSSAIRKAIGKRRDLRKERSSLASLPKVLEIVQAVRTPLAEVETSSLDDEIIAILDDQQRISAASLRAGVDARSHELEQDSNYDTLVDLDRRIREQDNHIGNLRYAKEKLEDAKRKTDLLSEVEKDIETLTERIRKSSGDEYSKVLDQLAHIESNLNEAIKRQAEVALHLDLLNRKGGAEELEATISELESKLAVAPKQVSDHLAEANESYREIAAEHHQRKLELIEREQESRKLDDQLERAIQLIGRGTDYQWIQNNVSANKLPNVRNERLDALRKLSDLATAANSVQSDIEEALNLLAALQDALDGIHISVGMHRELRRNPYVEQLIKWYEDQMAEFLSNSDISETLFGEERFERFDLMNGFISWRTASGEQTRRPIEAFSSGERAFSYMLTAILRHQESTAQHRVFVLDEFGAFVEQSRRSRLWHFLDERLVKAGLASQVVVILPLQGSSLGDKPMKKFEADGYFALEAQL